MDDMDDTPEDEEPVDDADACLGNLGMAVESGGDNGGERFLLVD